MKTFKYERAESFEEAATLMAAEQTADFMAGGTDLLGKLKDEILEEKPAAVIDLKRIPDADFIEVKDGALHIGALATLKKVAENEEIADKFPILTEAAHSVASPLIRNAATIGGNICQDVRCWFYRYPHEAAGRLDCARKCGEQCYAIRGENRYHSIFGGHKFGVSQCTQECPAGTDIPGYMAELRKGNWDAAADIIMQVNPMPMITSRICPHPCQDACNQCNYGDSVNTHCVERAVGDYILKNADKFYPAPAEETGKKVAIIGAGPSGLACAFYLRKQGHAVTVFDKQEKAGGVLQYGIPHYRLPKTIVDAYVDALAKMGVEFKQNTEIGKDIKIEEIEGAFDDIFIGTGAWKQPILGITGEEMTQFGLNFLVEVNKYLKKVASFGENILVCGGGNVAMDVALTAVRLGAQHVTMVCLEQPEEMPASKEEIERALEEGIEIINGRGLSKVIEEGGKVTGLETILCTSVFDENHRFNPQYDESDKLVIGADTIILATGQRVDLDFLGEKFLSEIKSPRGLIEADEAAGLTKRPHVYGGGDAVTGPNIAIRAIRGGAAAARSINAELGTPVAPVTYGREVLGFDHEGIMKNVSNKADELPVGERTLDVEDSSTLSDEAAIAEASRCMDCCCYAVSPSDIAPVLLCLDAQIVTTERTLSAAELFCTSPKVAEVLNKGEIVKEIIIPLQEGIESAYTKFRLREAIDFAIVSIASAFRVDGGKIAEAKLVFGGVAPMPRVADEVAEYLTGKEITEEVAEEAGALAVKDAIPLQYNKFKIEILKALVKETVLKLK